MKRVLISLALVLFLAMSLVAPAAAAKPESFSATGSIATISTGTVQPAGNSGRWRVVEREVTGFLNMAGVDEQFILNYKANVESVETQAGNFHGRMTVGDKVLEVNGTSEPVEMVFFPPFGVYLPQLAISGHYTFIDGANGNGTFDGWAIFIPTPGAPHIGIIVASSFSLSGKLVK